MTTWRQRLAAVLDWSPVAKGLLLPAMLATVLFQYLIWAWAVLQRADRERLVNVARLQPEMQWEAALMGGAVLVFLLGLYLRRRNPEVLWFQHLSIQYYAVALVVLGYTVGLNTVATGVVLLGAPVFGFIVLDRLAIWLGTLTAVILFLVLSVATVKGMLPYAPLLIPATDAAGAQFQLYSTLGFAAPHFLVLLLLADQTLHYWRQRESTIRELSRTDSLTSLPNRRSIMEMLEKEVARTRRHGPPLCVVILDLDHFKRINDTHGHPTGDKVLQRAAQVLRETIRTSDSIGRYGGEEFLIVLPDTPAVGARVLLERCRAALASTVIRAETGKTFHISASFGVVCNEKNMDVDAATLIKSADEALYQAKANGRNRVEIAA